jgi:hypothetical protein
MGRRASVCYRAAAQRRDGPPCAAASGKKATEAIGFVRNDKFVGIMSFTYDFSFSEISPQARILLSQVVGSIPDKAHMTGSGRFEISIQADL